jgi:hypothetical protein
MIVARVTSRLPGYKVTEAFVVRLMQFTKKLPDGQNLIINKAFWTGKTEVRLDNGILGEMKFKREQNFKFKYKDGTEHSLTIKQPFFDPMPLVLLDGNDIFASERFDQIQTAIICLPLLLVLKLGAIPAAIGCGSVYLNFFIARQNAWKKPLRWTAISVVPVIGAGVVFMVHGLVWGTQTQEKSDNGYYLQTQTTTHHYDPTEDDQNPRLWAQPKDAAETERQERWTREGR